ncbi:hypothetical protein [Kutzneria buriramensis]|uniref:Uncharacterized protein n=1 Tax=Kutzneria buriramensis TaxID=1045776 RepID=A0A3E0G6N8_9PSEU|nr:hypothetical protein [Kutzneria buriramensis]REH17467.1 hypothetical protein BCF44_14510 [Kutzneria buriramensis]
MSLPTAAAARSLVQQAVYTAVLSTLRQQPALVTIRQRYPFTTAYQTIWHTHLHQVRAASTLRVEWFRSWTPGWRQASQLASSQQPADPRHLTGAQLSGLLENSQDYLVHGTRNAEVGTCRAPLRAETNQADMSNPMQPVGVYAFRGITAALNLGYGPYCVVIRANANWQRLGEAWILRGEGSVPDSDIVGWFHQDDLARARQGA